ncbi:restriction endonuclease subunit S [Candidatus Peregrinibacteria bacterium]|nr:restriction endonuclease subunit S [Candidatus Peregrinibacteria bacterium]
MKGNNKPRMNTDGHGLPEGWEWKKLGEVCEVIGGGTPSKKVKDFYIGNIPWATVRDMQGEIVKKTKYRITEEAVKKSSTNIIPKGSVIIATRVGLGKVCLTNEDTAINQDLRGIIPKNSKKLYVPFLFRWFKNISYKIIGEGTGATVKGVKLPFIKGLAIPLPPLAEQKRIVAILDEAFAAIDKAKVNAEKNLSNAKELFDSYLNGIFANPGEDWEEKKLGEVYDVRDGTHDSPKYQDKGYPLITSKNLKDGVVSFNKIKYISENDYINVNKRSKVDIGDVLFAMIGTIGNPVVIVDDPTYAIKNVALFKVDNEKQSSWFLKYYLESNTVIKKMEQESKGTTQKFVGLGYLRNFKLLFPSLSKQKHIVNQLDKLSSEAKHLESIYQQRIAELDELKESILKKAFEGEL